MLHKLQGLACILLLLGAVTIAAADDAAAAARRQALMHSYGTYGASLRTPDGHIDSTRLLADLVELHANTYNWLIAGAASDWDDLHKFLPLARKHGIRVWVTLLPPSESPPAQNVSASRFANESLTAESGRQETKCGVHLL